MTRLPAPDAPPVRRLYSAEETRELDRRAIEEEGIPGIVLMRRAGGAAFDLLRRRWPTARSLTVFCGRGNNAGDGYVIAGLARSRGFAVQLLQVTDAADLSGDAGRARDWALDEGVVIEPFASETDIAGEVVVDALLGTGIRGAVRPDFAAAVERINTAGRPVLAVDLPSGLDADTGVVLGCAVRATATASFIGVKRGLMTAAGPDHAGELTFDDLGLPEAFFSGTGAPVGVGLATLGADDLLLAPRSRDAHKGRFGHVLVVGGDHGMGGAAALAAESALRCGTGLVSAATRGSHVAAILARTPEVMVRAVESRADLLPLLERASVVVLGPGLGQEPWGEQMFDAAVASGRPLLLDADGLNLLARRPQRREDWVLTPHPGEAARLLGCTTTEVGADRFAAVAALQQRFGGAVVLKGLGSLIAGGEDLVLAPYGNPGMATGGMGDVLSGVVGALLAQGLDPFRAARLGVCLHGAAGDAAAAGGCIGLAAGDLVPHLRRLLDGIGAGDRS
ncbi:MAG: NAD(P)H-hydrate dehydratase [Gammaproteobacteria bacterium]|nr:MAG: NAD(P)H-hydrate dehydratase [Gammaproteobacteria bacterium]